MLDIISPSELSALFSVIVIDLVLAGDNALVVGMAAAGLPKEQRLKVIAIGIAVATVLRIVFALGITYLLAIIGLLLAGGILLLWVSWKLWREVEDERRRRADLKRAGSPEDKGAAADEAAPEPKSFRAAVTQIVIADVTMSLDNVLGVAGAAREHVWVLVVGLVLSVGFMGAAATAIASLLKRYHWIAYVGTAIIAYVAVVMMWEGSKEILDAVS